MTQTATIINVIPQRIAADHYQTQSFTEAEKTYDQHYDYDLRRWLCNCEDTTYNKNPNCKHVILLRAYIQKAEQASAPEQHSSSAELISILNRISKLEQAQGDAETSIINTEKESMLLQRDLEEHEALLASRAEQERAMRQQIAQQAKQIEELADIVRTLQVDICRLNERTNNQQRTIEDQAQQIDALHDQIESQARPAEQAEQIVRVAIEGAIAKAQQERKATSTKAEDMTIKPVRDGSGKVVACKVSKFNVKVQGNCAAGCDCSIGIMDRQCPHMAKVDQFLSK